MRTGLALLLCLAGGALGGELGDEEALRRLGPKALPEILSLVDAADPDLRLRARRLAKLIATDYYRAQTPKGMRLVPGPITVSASSVRMEGVYLGIHEITAREFVRYAKERKLKSRRWEKLDPALPVIHVTLDDARGFATWRNARLPTREEFERAATADGHTLYPWGNRFEPHRVNSREAGLGAALAPGSRPLGRSAAGLCDLLGNVAEWTSTRAVKSRGARFHVVGGSFLSHTRGVLSGGRLVTYKLRAVEHKRDVGFRLARSLPPLPAKGS